jgi:hypothetical protein
MHPRRLIVPLVAAAFLAVVAGGSAAASVPGTSLPLSGYGHMLVDSATNHVFITGSSSDSTILVRNADGSAAGSIAGETGAGGMVIDGGTLYVARCGAGVIDEFDTTTLTSGGSIAAANIGGGCDLAEAGGALWYTDSSNHLVSVTLDVGHTTTVTGFLVDGRLATTPAHPTWLVGVFSEAYVDLFDATDPTAPTELATTFSPSGGDAINDIAVTADGAELLVASGAPYHIIVLNLPDLTDAGTTYGTNSNYPKAIAVSSDGTLVAAGALAFYDKDVYLYASGSQTAKSTWDFGGTSDTLYPGGLAFSADATKLYAISKGSTGSGVVLHVLPTVPVAKGKVSIKASASTVLAGHGATITAHLGTASTNRRLSIYRTPAGGTAILITTARVNRNGNLAVTVHPSATTRYTAVWSGDATHAQTSAGVTVKARLIAHAKAQGGYRTVKGVRLYHYARSCSGSSHTRCPSFLTSSTPLLPGHTVNVVVQAQRASGSWYTVVKGSQTTGADGKLLDIIYYTNRAAIGVPQRIHFTYPNDPAHLGNTSAWVHYRVTT